MYEGTLYRGAIVRLPAIVVEREGRAIPYLPVDHRHYCLGCAQLVACPDPDPACLRRWRSLCEGCKTLVEAQQEAADDPAALRYRQYRDALRANQARALGAGIRDDSDEVIEC